MVGLCRSLGMIQSCLGSLLLTECLSSIAGKDSGVKLPGFHKAASLCSAWSMNGTGVNGLCCCDFCSHLKWRVLHFSSPGPFQS